MIPLDLKHIVLRWANNFFYFGPKFRPTYIPWSIHHGQRAQVAIREANQQDEDYGVHVAGEQHWVVTRLDVTEYHQWYKHHAQHRQHQ